MTTDICDCDFFEFGDMVRSRQNPHLTGQVIGAADWGDRYHVRLADGAATIWWFAIEMEHDPDFHDLRSVESDDTNVTQVDFTKRRVITPDTDTEGAA